METDIKKACKPLSETEFFKLFKEKCKTFKKVTTSDSKNKIYRGINSKEDFILCDIESSNVNRKSRDWDNWSNLIFSNVATWSAFPKRNKSIICTCDFQTAAAYSGSRGNIYVVIPLDGAEFGICPKPDIVDVFNQKRSVGMDLEDFNAMLTSIFKTFIKSHKEDTSYQALLDNFDALSALPKEEKQKVVLAIKNDQVWKKCFSTENLFAYENKDESLLETILELLDPKRNMFKVGDYAKWDKESLTDNEVWTDTNCLMVKYPTFRKMKSSFLPKEKKKDDDDL